MRTHSARTATAFALLVALAAPTYDCFAFTCVDVRTGYEVSEKVKYFRDDRTRKVGRREFVLEAADPTTFRQLPSNDPGRCARKRADYGKDKNFVFFEEHVVEGADPATYTFLGNAYAKDKDAIYSHTRRLTTRVDDFHVIPHRSPYATDGDKFFYHDNIIDDAGVQFLGEGYLGTYGYVRTKSDVYRYGRVIPGTDAESFEVYIPSVHITRDKNFVYFKDQPLANADPLTFVQIHMNSFKDRRAVYFEGKEVYGADPASVRVSKFGMYILDDLAVYRGEKVIADRDPKTFSELLPPWSKDKNGVYYQDGPFEADLSTFRATAVYRAEDRSYRFQGRKKVCKFDRSDSTPLPVCQ